MDKGFAIQLLVIHLGILVCFIWFIICKEIEKRKRKKKRKIQLENIKKKNRMQIKKYYKNKK